MIEWPDDVVDAIARRRSAIVIGSGVSANSTGVNDTRPPTWADFLDMASQQTGRKAHIEDALKRFDYLEACAYLEAELGNNWPSFVREKFSTPRYRPAEIHKEIFNLDSRIVISLNFDKIYDNHANSTTEGTVVIKNYYDEDIREAVSGPDRYVIKPHGTVDSISKIIFTLDDYAKARVEHASFYEVLNALLHTHLLLFLGCGLTDPDLQILFEDYRYRYNENPHYITQPSPVAEEKVNLIKKTRGINILQYSSDDNHKELTESISALVRLVRDKRDLIAIEQSW